MSKAADSTSGYSFAQLMQMAPNLKKEQTYRVEFSWKYAVNTDSSDVCSTWFGMWGIVLANLVPSTTSSKLANRHYLSTLPQCGTTDSYRATAQPAQKPGEWKRYCTYYRWAPRFGDTSYIWFGLQCDAGVQAKDQKVFFDDITITPVAAC
ncbi:hypothetical protein E8E11_007393 [Didymella keratinophila]|nr:hypothetical protein E8E11_007393 [Didymella keratinophila]